MGRFFRGLCPEEEKEVRSLKIVTFSPVFPSERLTKGSKKSIFAIPTDTFIIRILQETWSCMEHTTLANTTDSTNRFF